MTRVYWSAVDARRRTVYRCRILPADDSTASKNPREIKSEKMCTELFTDGVTSTSTLPDTATVETSVTAADRFRTPFSIFSDDFSCRKVDQRRSNKSDEVACDSLTTQCRNELSSSRTINATASTEGKPYRQAANDNYIDSCRSDSTCGDFSTRVASSRGMNCCTGCRKSTGDHIDCTAASAMTNRSRLLFQPGVPAQHRSFADAADKTDTGCSAAAERNIYAAGLQSEFDAHTQLKCVPLKLISQLDGAVPDSESEASDEEADTPASCYDILSRSLVTPDCHRFAADQGVTRSPFKCVKCKRVYRTEESCALHSAVCTFEVSSSSESEKSDSNGDWVLDRSDQDTESCYSDADDDGVISEYLNSSRNSENAANCSFLGCQRENILVATEDCDVNANCKMLYNSKVKTDHLKLGTAGSDSIISAVENLVRVPCTEILQRFQNPLNGAVKCSATCDVENRVCCSALDLTVQVQGSVGNELSVGAEKLSYRQLPEFSSLDQENLSCYSQADDLIDSHASCRLSVCEREAVQSSDASISCSQLSCSSVNSRKDVPVTSAEGAYPSDFHLYPDHSKSKAGEGNVAGNKQLMGLSVAEFNAVSSVRLAGEEMSSVIDSSKASVISTSYDTVEQFSSCVASSFHAGKNASLSGTADVTFSSSACMSSLQDILTSSATMVWPSATVYPSVVNNHSISSVTSPSGVYTQLLEAHRASRGMMTTASNVPSALPPNAVAAACIRPVNIAHPVYAVGHVPVPTSSPGQPVRAVQQFLHPVLVTPVALLAPQLAVMNAVRLCLPVSQHPTVTSPCSSLYLSSQQSSASVHAANAHSANPQLLSQYRASIPEPSHFILQKAVNSAAFATQVIATHPQSFGLRLPSAAATSLPPGYMQSVRRADVSSQQSVCQLTSTVSQPVSASLTVAAVPSLHSSLLRTSSVSINQLPVGHNPSPPMHHVSAPAALSKYVVSSGGMFFSWLTGTTPVTVNSLSSSPCGHKKSLSAVKSDFQATVANKEAEANVSIAHVVGNLSCLTQAAPRFNGLLPINNGGGAAYCSESMPCRASCAMSLLVSGTGDTSLSSRPRCVISSSALPLLSTVASCCLFSHHSPPVNSLWSGTESPATKRLPGSSAKSPRVVMQPSFIVVTTQPEMSMNVVPSNHSTQCSSVTHLPSVSNRLQQLISFSDCLSYAHKVSDAEFSPAYSAFTSSVSTVSSQTSKPLPRIASFTECPVDMPLVCSPSVSTETKDLSGK